MSIGVLGPLTVESRYGSVAIPGGREAALLQWLVLHRPTGVSVGATVDSLWPGVPVRAAEEALRGYVARLRRRLASVDATVSLLYAERRLRLDIGAACVDVADFEKQLATASRALTSSVPRAAEAAFGYALRLWRGDPYPGLVDTHQGLAEAARLRELHDNALEAVLGLRLARGGDANLIPDLVALAEHHPLREQVCRLLMVAMAAEGRAGDALRAYQRCRVALAELGALPAPQTRRVEQAILEHQGLDVVQLVVEEYGVRRRDPLPGPAVIGVGQGADVDLTATVGRWWADVWSGARLIAITCHGDGTQGRAVETLRAVVAATAGASMVLVDGGSFFAVRTGLEPTLGHPNMASIIAKLAVAGSGDGEDFTDTEDFLVATRWHDLFAELASMIRDVARASPVALVFVYTGRGDAVVSWMVQFLADALDKEPVLLVAVSSYHDDRGADGLGWPEVWRAASAHVTVSD